MRRFHAVLAGFALAAGALIPAAVAQADSSTPTQIGAPPANPVYNGCPSGDVCMYTRDGWTEADPEHKYFKYQCYNLTNELGTRVIYNVQTGGATVTGWYGSGCTGGKAWTFSPDKNFGWVVDITPINSISLQPAS